MRCCWVLLLFSFFSSSPFYCHYFCALLPFISWHMSCRDVSCAFFFFFISVTMDVVERFHLNWTEEEKQKQNKTMAMLRAWFLTPPQWKWKWNKSEKKMRDARTSTLQPLFLMNLTDWLGHKIRNKYTRTHTDKHKTTHKIVFGALSPLAFMWSFVFLFCINNKLQYNSVKSFCAITTSTHSDREREREQVTAVALVALDRSEKR